jgi:hypothetical protein
VLQGNFVNLHLWIGQRKENVFGLSDMSIVQRYSSQKAKAAPNGTALDLLLRLADEILM